MRTCETYRRIVGGCVQRPLRLSREPISELVRPTDMNLARYALTRLRGWYALAMAGRGRDAPPAPDLDARIADAIRGAQRPDRFGWVSGGSETRKAPE
ncbi:hypothetical protein TPB0596_32340 [Tsukamurella pulmonis]|nr:hypothetical protein TPB0596_32340 [Tsukamurella pulmonis]